MNPPADRLIADDPVAAPVPRGVILGASNVIRGLSIAADSVRLALGPHSELAVVAGHGRSYGRSTCVALRRIGAIRDAALWPHLAAQKNLHALVTDVGNDIMYGEEVPVILGWVDECVDRLARAGAQLVIAAPPMVRLRRLSPSAYRLLRAVLFPGHAAPPFTVALERAEALHAGLGALAAARGAAWIEPEPRWYGVDPIHIRGGAMAEAWRALVRPWASTEAPQARGSLWRWWRVHTVPLFGSTVAGVPLGGGRRDPRPIPLAGGPVLRLY